MEPWGVGTLTKEPPVVWTVVPGPTWFKLPPVSCVCAPFGPVKVALPVTFPPGGGGKGGGSQGGPRIRPLKIIIIKTSMIITATTVNAGVHTFPITRMSAAAIMMLRIIARMSAALGNRPSIQRLRILMIIIVTMIAKIIMKIVIAGLHTFSIAGISVTPGDEVEVDEVP